MLGFFDFYLSPKSHLMRIVKTTTKPLSAVKPHPQTRSPPAVDYVDGFVSIFD